MNCVGEVVKLFREGNEIEKCIYSVNRGDSYQLDPVVFFFKPWSQKKEKLHLPFSNPFFKIMAPVMNLLVFFSLVMSRLFRLFKLSQIEELKRSFTSFYLRNVSLPLCLNGVQRFFRTILMHTGCIYTVKLCNISAGISKPLRDTTP